MGVSLDAPPYGSLNPVLDAEFITSELHRTDRKSEGSKEKVLAVEEVNNAEGDVKRSLKQRHLSMMAIGGAIGTGLFLGMGSSLQVGGPLGLLFGYLVMGTVVFSLQLALAELCTFLPVSGSLTHYAARFVDPALGFALGWNYWYSFVVCVGGEITAAAIVIEYWNLPVKEGVWITLLLFQFFWSKMVWRASLKILAVAILVITGIILNLGGGPSHDRIGFRYWKDPGVFTQYLDTPGAAGRFLGFWSVFIQSAYSYIGTETVALAAGEASNPRKTVPRALSSVFYRILIFYVTSAFIIGILVPYNDPNLLGGKGDASASPFVIAINRAGIRYLPDIINGFVLVSAYSGANTQAYAGSRVLYGLAKDGMAPRFLAKCTKDGLPLAATLLSVLPGFLAYMNLSVRSSVIFIWLVNVSAMGGLLAWWSIFISYIRFYNSLKAQGISRDTLHYKAPLQPYLSYYGIILLTAIIFLNGFQTFLPGRWSWTTFIGSYITLPVFLLTYLFWKIFKKTKVVAIEKIDLHTHTKEFDEMSDEK